MNHHTIKHVNSIAVALTIVVANLAGISVARADTKAKEITVFAQPQPERALKYHLLPTVIEQEPGNAAVTYLMAATNLPDKPWPKEYDKWLELPLAELPVDQINAAVGGMSDLAIAAEGARRDRVEWDTTNIRVNGVMALLPHIQSQRTLARRFALRIRLLVKQKKYDAAIEDIKTGMAMGHHLEEGGTLIEALVGMAVCNLMCDRLEELVQQPDAPNLYWALAELPQPLVNMRKGMQYEQHWIEFMIRQAHLKRADNSFDSKPGTVSNDIAFLVSAFASENFVTGESSDAEKMQAQFMAAGIAIYRYPRAKRYFMEKKGMTAEEVEKLPVAQVALSYSMERYRYWRDEMFKWLNVPHHQAAPHLEKMMGQFKNAMALHDGFPFTMLLPAIDSAKRAEGRLDRRIAAIQVIEALRIHAAAHGQWPTTLEKLDVPAPFDPMTGKAFTYSVKDGVATLKAEAAKGDNQKQGIHFLIKLQAKPEAQALPESD